MIGVDVVKVGADNVAVPNMKDIRAVGLKDVAQIFVDKDLVDITTPETYCGGGVVGPVDVAFPVAGFGKARGLVRRNSTAVPCPLTFYAH